jgi:L-asparaginase II
MILVTKFYRGSIIESFHIGYAVAVDGNNNVIFSAGNPEYPVFIRSAAKPFQAVPVLESGAVEKFRLSDEEIAIMCGSHNGEVYHVETVSAILRKIGMGVDDLKCGIHPPLDRLSHEQLILKGRRPTALHNACSGKHAGMLALSKVLDTPADNYLDNDHPVQKMIFEKIKLYSEKNKVPIAVDGCGAPTFFLPLKNIAIMYRKLMDGSDPYLQKISHIMCLHPELIGGRDNFDTDFISALGGKAISKFGAEGVRGIGVQTQEGNSVGIAIKVLSGKKTASASMAIAIIKHLKLINEESLEKLSDYYIPAVKNHIGTEVGKIETEIVVEENK